ncbi:MAG: hypothetical protein AAGA64_18680 [Bacteroidota bacterium]
MTKPELWKKILNFELDDEDSDFTFSQRLARDNKWSHEFSKSVILEYKKFIYLCCVGSGEITPSDSVDQAWHLHLTYTRSYWVDMCKNTLGMNVHHNPTKGGDNERKRYSNDYDALHGAYLREFEVEPSKVIWPGNEERFSNVNFKRINLSDYWLLRKPNLRHPAIIVVVLPILTLLFIQSDKPIPWGSLIVIVILLLFVARTIKGGGKGGKRRKNGSDSGSGWWSGFWGCSSDGDSGCSSHGCSSGCSGCGGGGD